MNGKSPKQYRNAAWSIYWQGRSGCDDSSWSDQHILINQGALEGTEYGVVMAGAKQLFIRRAYEKQEFFSNPQKFPSIIAQYCWAKQ